MFIDHYHKFCYIAIPKTGTYAVHSFFGYTHGHPEPSEHHIGARDLLLKRPELDDYFFFAFVRNPYAKLVSIYHDFTLRRGHQYSENVRYEKPLLSEFKDFKDFCLKLKDSPWYSDIFFRPQIESVIRPNGNFIEFHCKYERLQEGMDYIADRFYLDRKVLRVENKGKYDRPFESFYDCESRSAIIKAYKEDFDAFDYQT